MVKNFLRSRRRLPGGSAPGQLGPGRRVYAVGDVHGCADRLWGLHDMIAADLRARPIVQPLLLHIGDLIDRGPDSAAIVARLAAGDPIPGLPTVNLMGNHEFMALDALAGPDPDAPSLWLDNGGGQSLLSWGVQPGAPVRFWAEAIGPEHLRFLRDLALEHIVDGYAFVHAGYRPGIRLPEQSRDDRLWIREPFLDARAPVLPDQPDLVVVHGHTPTHRPVIRSSRIGIDTGAVRDGALTCAVLEADRLGFLQN